MYGREELALYLEDDEEEDVDVDWGRAPAAQAAVTTSQEDLQTLVLEKKKQLMLEKYA